MSLLPLPFSVLSGASASLTGALVASVWQGVLLTVLVAVCLRLLSGLSPAARSALWTAMLFLVASLPLFFLLRHDHASQPAAAVMHGDSRMSALLLLLWAVASAVRLLQLGHSAFRLHGILRRATPVAASHAVTAWLRRGSRPVRLCLSGDVDRPSVAGFFRPRILLPPDLYMQLSEADLRQIVLHEMEHLRRWDDWINLLQQLSLVVFPLNPALHWLNGRLAAERELACDDGVLRTTHARKAYAACLTRVAETSLLRRGAALALGVLGDWFGVWHRRPELARRVERVLRAPRPGMGRLQTRFATGALLTTMAAGAGVLAHGPELVSFGPVSRITVAETAARPWPDAVVTDRQTARPALVRASMTGRVPEMQSTLAVLPSHGMRPRLPVRKRAHARSLPWVLTSWDRPASAARGLWAPMHFTPVVFQAPEDPQTPRISQNSQRWYTAVPLRNGWLIFQL